VVEVPEVDVRVGEFEAVQAAYSEASPTRRAGSVAVVAAAVVAADVVAAAVAVVGVAVAGMAVAGMAVVAARSRRSRSALMVVGARYRLGARRRVVVVGDVSAVDVRIVAGIPPAA